MTPEKRFKKIPKKIFMSVYPSDKSQFLILKKVKKKTVLQIVPRINWPEKHFFFYDLPGVFR
jgi:hypothetical protein